MEKEINQVLEKSGLTEQKQKELEELEQMDGSPNLAAEQYFVILPPSIPPNGNGGFFLFLLPFEASNHDAYL